MRVDIQSLETFNRLASEGTEQATAMLAQITGIEADVDVTKITLTNRADVGETLADQALVGIQFDFDGALSGDTVLVFEEACTDPIVAALPGGTENEMRESSIEEIGNIMMSGFIDGWADYLETTIEHSPPEYVAATGQDVLPATGDADAEQVFVFKSHMELPEENEDLQFSIYMLPEYDDLVDLMSAQSDTEGDAIPVDKLSVFNEMTEEGTAKAAQNVSQMTGIETEAEVSQISFAPVEDVPKQVDDREYVGTAVEFEGVPGGYLAILFDEESAIRVAEALMPSAPDGDGFTEAHENAIEEMGNIMTSGFIDGWANVLQTSVEHTPPRVVHDMGRAILDPLAARVGQHQEHAFVIESRMEIEDLSFGAEIHALPNDEQLKAALEDLQVERSDQTEANVEQIFE